MALGILGGPSVIGTDGALGIIDPKGQSWNNATYQACIGHRIQSCGAQGYQAGWSSAQVNACIDAEQQKCIAQAKAAMTSAWTSGQVATLQQKVNAALAKYGYCPIDVDGQLGPMTCGASAWATKTDPSISVPGACGSTVKMGSGFLVDCAPKQTVAPELPPVTKPAYVAPVTKPAYVAPPPKPAPASAPTAYLPPAKAKTSTANMLMIGGAVAAVAVAGYFVAKKKGLIK